MSGLDFKVLIFNGLRLRFQALGLRFVLFVKV